MMDSLFPDIPPDPVPPINEPKLQRLSAGRRLTERRALLVAAGYHPLSNVLPRLPLNQDPQLRCGGCSHVMHNYRGYIKCDLWPSRSDASDIRLKWPACINWTPREEPDDPAHG